MMSEGTLLTKFSERFCVCGGPSLNLHLVTLVFEGTHDRSEKNLLFCSVNHRLRFLVLGKRASTRFESVLRFLDLTNLFFSIISHVFNCLD